MLFSDGAPLTPAGGSSCNLQGNRQGPRGPAPASAPGRPRPAPGPALRPAWQLPPPRPPRPRRSPSLYLLKSLMRRRRAGVDISLAGSGVGHTPRSRVPADAEEAEEAEGAEADAEGAPRGTALPLRSRGSVWRRLSTTPE